MIVEMHPNEYVNTDQIEIIRKATPTETAGRRWAKGRHQPITTIILQNDVRYYVKGYPSEIVKKINDELEKQKKCG
jgi:hypothetical protein